MRFVSHEIRTPLNTVFMGKLLIFYMNEYSLNGCFVN